MQQFVCKLLARSFWNKLQVTGKVLIYYNKLQKQATDNKQQVVCRFTASAAKQVTLQQVTGKSYVNYNQLQQVTAIYRKPVIL